MNSILMTMFAAVVATCTALTFVEVRRIRKKLEKREETADPILIKRSAA
jgi:hypothetical protein